MKRLILALVMSGAAAATAFAQNDQRRQIPEWLSEELREREEAIRLGRPVSPLPPPPNDPVSPEPSTPPDGERQGRPWKAQGSKPAASFNVWMRSLHRRNEGCAGPETFTSLSCASAASRWCQEDGYVGGYMIENDSRGRAVVVCN